MVLLFVSISSYTLDREGKLPPSNCQGDTAGILLKLTVNGPRSQTNQSYETIVNWQGEIVTPDSQNTCGNTDPFNITKTYCGSRNGSGDYTIEQASMGQCPGTWKFTVTALNSSSNCNSILTAGNTKLAFTHQQSGC